MSGRARRPRPEARAGAGGGLRRRASAGGVAAPAKVKGRIEGVGLGYRWARLAGAAADNVERIRRSRLGPTSCGSRRGTSSAAASLDVLRRPSVLFLCRCQRSPPTHVNDAGQARPGERRWVPGRPRFWASSKLNGGSEVEADGRVRPRARDRLARSGRVSARSGSGGLTRHSCELRRRSRRGRGQAARGKRRAPSRCLGRRARATFRFRSGQASAVDRSSSRPSPSRHSGPTPNDAVDDRRSSANARGGELARTTGRTATRGARH